jgi:hypothetical protein
MKRLLFIIGLIFGAVSTACAQQHAPAASRAINDEAVTDVHLSSIYTDGKCHFRIAETSRQRYDTGLYMFDPTNANPTGWSFGFACHTGASQDDIVGQLGAKRVDGQWISEDFSAPFTPAQHFQTYTLAGKNWTGRVTAYDQTTGDEDTRQRFFLFCLVETHGPQVLCGQVQGLTIGTVNTADKIKKVLAVLKTLVFVDQPANPPTASSAAAGH